MRTLIPEWCAQIDRTLRQGTNGEGQESVAVDGRAVLVLLIVSGASYGMAMGSYSWLVGSRSLVAGSTQMLYSGLKVPILLLTTFLISVPTFYVLNSLLGLRDDFRIAVRNIVVAQATISIILMSMAPLVVLWYASSPDTAFSYRAAVLLNTGLFAIASFASQVSLRRMYRPLSEVSPLHQKMLWVWTSIYALVGIQMGWVLRPFIGSPDQATSFFRSESWNNAYIKVFQIVRSLIHS